MITKLIHDSWNEQLKNEFTKPYINDLTAFLKKERAANTIYPKETEVFNAFNLTASLQANHPTLEHRSLAGREYNPSPYKKCLSRENQNPMKILS